MTKMLSFSGNLDLEHDLYLLIFDRHVFDRFPKIFHTLFLYIEEETNLRYNISNDVNAGSTGRFSRLFFQLKGFLYKYKLYSLILSLFMLPHCFECSSRPGFIKMKMRKPIWKIVGLQ